MILSYRDVISVMGLALPIKNPRLIAASTAGVAGLGIEVVVPSSLYSLNNTTLIRADDFWRSFTMADYNSDRMQDKILRNEEWVSSSHTTFGMLSVCGICVFLFMYFKPKKSNKGISVILSITFFQMEILPLTAQIQ